MSESEDARALKELKAKVDRVSRLLLSRTAKEAGALGELARLTLELCDVVYDLIIWEEYKMDRKP